MPRKLPKSATQQFTDVLDQFEAACVRMGKDPEWDHAEHQDTVNSIRNKIVKMFESKGT